MSKSNVYKLQYPTKWSLYLSYMPWFKRGGVFIPSRDKVHLGEEILMLVSLPESTDMHAVSGQVSWLSVDASGGKKAGFGVHFSDSAKCKEVKAAMENIAAGWAKSDKQTYLM